MSRSTVSQISGFVTIKRTKWQRLQKQVAELQHALRVISQGEAEWRTEKTRQVRSLKELLKT